MREYPTKTKMLMHFLRKCKLLFVMGAVFTCSLSFVELINPKVIGYTIDGLIENPSLYKDKLVFISLFVITVALVSACLRYGFGILNAKASERLVKNMRDDLYSHILYLPYAWHGENKTGDIIQRCTSDVDTIKRFLSEELTTLLRTILMIVFSLIFMFRISVPLTFVSFAFVPIVVIYSLIFHKKIGSAFFKVDIEEGVLSSIAQENLTGVRVVRAFGREAYEKDRFMTQNEKYTGMWVYMMRLLSRFWAVMDFISGLQILSVLACGAYFCVMSNMTPGDYVAFVSYNAMLVWPIKNLGRVIADMSKAGISIERIQFIMNSALEKDIEGATTFPENKDISFNNVTYRYENTQIPVLQNISVDIKEGMTVGILGKTGSGKSTLVHLLDALYELPDDNGTITIGGVDIRNIRKDELRKNIGLVLQEPYLFSRTLGENIAIGLQDNLGKDEVSDAVKEASDIACLSGTIERFSDKYETLVGERGVTLSGGQKQRTAIATMMIRKPPIMIFDDSLSAVDTKTDEAIRRGIKENTDKTTVFLISHRLTTLQMADLIIVLDDGKISQMGTHEELINTPGLYQRIYNLQSGY